MSHCTTQAFATAAASVGGESLCIWQRGQQRLLLCSGEASPGTPWDEHTLVPIFSATKPLSAACLLQALHEHGLSPATPVGELWPAFPAPRCRIGELLSHQAGLAAWAHTAPFDDLEACRKAIEASAPAWAPPQHGYHPHAFGPLVDLLMLALTGERICHFWETRVRRPLGLDVYLSLPESEHHRVAQLRPPRLPGGAIPRTPFYTAYTTPGSPTYRAFHCVSGLASIREMNTPAARQCACPARGGIASARGLAMAYQALLCELPGSPFLPQVREWLSTPLCKGEDLTLLTHTAFSCGAMCEPAALVGGSGFGHPGAGGFHAFAHPATGCSFAYVMNGMQLSPLPSQRVCDLISAMLHDFS